MCLAVYTAPGARLTREQFFTAWENNDDGGGLAYFNEYGLIEVVKSVTPDWLWKKYMEKWDEYGEESPFLVHFRIGTSGTPDITNVHPFHLNRDTVAIHNGVITQVKTSEGRNDTRVFIEDYLRLLPDDWLDQPTLVHMVEDFLRTDKMVFLTANSDLEYSAYILNESCGHWNDDEDIWFSNYSYKKSSYKSFGLSGNKTYKKSSSKEDKSPKKESANRAEALRATELDLAIAWDTCCFCAGDLYGDVICWTCGLCLFHDDAWDECDCWSADDKAVESMRPEPEIVTHGLLAMTDEEFREFMSVH